jgi:hypothetical protein
LRFAPPGARFSSGSSKGVAMVRADRRISPARVVLIAAAIVAALALVARATGTSGSELFALGFLASLLLGLVGLVALAVLALHRWIQRRGKGRT